MSLESRVESLKGRHASLETRIHDEDLRPRPDGEALNRLKLEKLRLKERSSGCSTGRSITASGGAGFPRHRPTGSC